MHGHREHENHLQHKSAVAVLHSVRKQYITKSSEHTCSKQARIH